jgi:hypothetical protein
VPVVEFAGAAVVLEQLHRRYWMHDQGILHLLLREGGQGGGMALKADPDGAEVVMKRAYRCWSLADTRLLKRSSILATSSIAAWASAAADVFKACSKVENWI